jgi:hypothetical protein
VPVLDPLEIQELKIADGGARQVGLTLTMENAKVFGMKDSELKVTRSVNSPTNQQVTTYHVTDLLLSIGFV